MKCGVAKKNGSAFLNDGLSKVTCNVYACRSVERTKCGYTDKGTFTVTARFAPFSNVNSTKVREDEKLLSSRLRSSLESALQLEKFPKSVLEAHIVILDACSSSTFSDIQSASTTCLSLAIANAGIDMNDLVVGTNIEITTKKKKLSSLCLAIMPSLEKITYISHDGETEPEALLSVRHESLSFSLSFSYSLSHSIRQYPRDLKNQNILKKSCEIHCLYRNKKTSSLYILFIVIDLYIYS